MALVSESSLPVQSVGRGVVVNAVNTQESPGEPIITPSDPLTVFGWDIRMEVENARNAAGEFPADTENIQDVLAGPSTILAGQQLDTNKQPLYDLNSDAMGFNGDFLDYGLTGDKPANWTIFLVTVLNGGQGFACGSADPGGATNTLWGAIQLYVATLQVFCANEDDAGYIETRAVADLLSSYRVYAFRYTDGDTFIEMWDNGVLLALVKTVQTADHCAGTEYKFSFGRPGESDGGYMNGGIKAGLVKKSAMSDEDIASASNILITKYGL